MFCNCSLAGTKACENCHNNGTASTFTKRKEIEWIISPYPGDDRLENYKCPNCGKSFAYTKVTESRPNFCMNCGAKAVKPQKFVDVPLTLENLSDWNNDDK